MESVSKNNKLIAKNTMFLYIRMGMTMLVQLYTSRIVLQYLGVDNYGIYNVVGSFVVAFAFLQYPIEGAVQRFLNYELGRENGSVNSIMNLSFVIYLVLSVALFFLVEIIGYWYMNYKMILPMDRMDAARFAFHLSLLSLLLIIIRSPFEGLIVAHEKMTFYAYVSILDVILKLLNAFSLKHAVMDSLKQYAINQVIITLLIAVALYAFCRRNFSSEIKIKPIYSLKKLKEIATFSWWSFLGGAASMTANQGVNVLLNMFFGVAVNAAMGIAVQVQTSLQQFVFNFQKAFNPQIVKLYASNNLPQMRLLVSRASRFSYLLLFMFFCPVVFNIEFFLGAWLKNVPEGTSVFCIYLLIWQLLECLMAPMWTSINATGNIRNYNLVINPIILSVIIFSYVALKMGFPAYSVVLIKCIIDVVLLAVRMKFAQKMIGFEIGTYIKRDLLPLLVITMMCVAIQFVICSLSECGWRRVVIGVPIFFACYFMLVLKWGVSPQERSKIVDFARMKLGKLKSV